MGGGGRWGGGKWWWENGDNCIRTTITVKLNLKKHTQPSPWRFSSGFQYKLGWCSNQEQIESVQLGGPPKSRCILFLLGGKKTQHKSGFHIFRTIYRLFCLVMNMHLNVLLMNVLLELGFSVISQLKSRFFFKYN